MITRTLRLLGLAAALPLALSACHTGSDPGDTNVEQGSAKQLQTEHQPSRDTPNGDSLAAGIKRDTTRRPTGKQLYNSADRAVDRNHDGIAD